MGPLRLLPLLAAFVLAAAACGPASPSPAPSTASPDAACASAPEVAGADGWGPPATTPTLIPFLVSNNITCGHPRMLFLYLDSENRVVSAPDRTASVAFFNLARDPNTPVATAAGTFVWTIQDERGMYAIDVDLPEAGLWGAEFTTEAPDSPPETVRLTFTVLDEPTAIAVSQPAPASKTPTLADVGGDVSKISTDATPTPAFYETSVASALAAHEPFILIFATPKFCQTAQCGPTLDQFKLIAAAHPDVTFINVEPYELEDVGGQLQPVLDTNGQLVATDVTREWGLLAEPWIFAVDRAGIVRGSYEITIADQELDEILPVITAGG
ncbi:MAG: hypothetical protein H0T59_11880 [Chloroflexi bacterium]|nr:hypothetical protein [Chloroflexota bacterium]